MTFLNPPQSASINRQEPTERGCVMQALHGVYGWAKTKRGTLRVLLFLFAAVCLTRLAILPCQSPARCGPGMHLQAYRQPGLSQGGATRSSQFQPEAWHGCVRPSTPAAGTHNRRHRTRAHCLRGRGILYRRCTAVLQCSILYYCSASPGLQRFVTNMPCHAMGAFKLPSVQPV